MKGVGSLHLFGTSGCLVQIVNDDLWIALVILICSEGLAFGLLVAKAMKYARELKYVDRSNATRNILTVMAQDGIAYFACTLAITATNLFLLKNLNPDFQDIFIITQGALENILCGRLLFHVRVVQDTHESHGSWSTSTFSGAPNHTTSYGGFTSVFSGSGHVLPSEVCRSRRGSSSTLPEMGY
ncbi:hypothetical protein SCHPADRAFT_557852 [Schizopora paradoxa]|uniref:Uncharacterized protein n=1 Tax=Schizopora paradoxa TaxID=27342 RepID=A0A0H2RJJ1_9AGAM|nr:hypothetical protein SCHPADRAFT_557852 [Schizopora paradoxa]